MRRRFGWVLLIALLVVPLVEIYLLVQVGQVIGAWWTIGLLILSAIVGSWLIKREGVRAWQALRDALAGGRMPARELADGALILVGGTLMLTPGFVTDTVGVLLVLPLTRPVFRRVLGALVGRRLLGAGVGFLGPHPGGPGPHRSPGGSGPDATHPGPGSQGPVVRGEVIDEP